MRRRIENTNMRKEQKRGEKKIIIIIEMRTMERKKDKGRNEKKQMVRK